MYPCTHHHAVQRTYSYRVTPSTFASNAKLAKFYNLLSTNTDRKGRVFGSTIEGRKYPVFGTQWHPEKNIFEWTEHEAIPHSVEAVRVAQYTANFFVDLARQSTHAFSYSDLDNVIIYNWTPTFSERNGSGFEQVYTFPPIAHRKGVF